MASEQTKKLFYFITFLIQFNVAFSQHLRCEYNRTHTSIEEACDKVVTGFIPHPTDCTAFILCLLGSPNIYWCDEKRPIFDPYHCNCVAGEKYTIHIH